LNLGLCISQLLQDNETVIVPGFCAFVSVYKPAKIDEENKQILPPSKEILFNQKIRNNDGLLVRYIADNEGISHFEALQKIKKEREKILYQLDKGDKITLENVGLLFYDQTGLIQFESFEKQNLSPDSFGLEAAGFQEYSGEVIGKDTEIIESNINESDSVADAGLESNFVEQPGNRMLRELAGEEEKKRRGWLWLLFIIIPFSAVGIYMFLNQDKPSRKPIEIQTEKTLPQVQKENNVIGGVNPVKIDSVPVTKDINVATRQDTIPKADNQNASGKTKYFLIGGSFREEDNADEYFQELKKMGYEPFHLGKKGNFFLVGINIYYSEREALSEQRLFLENNPGSGAWVYIE
jgi:hypothetical protein